MSAGSRAASDGPDWKALYDEHRTMMYRVAVRELAQTGRGDTDAMDIVQGVFVSMIKASPSAVDDWARYLATATRNRVTSYFRQAEHQRAQLALLADDGEPRTVEPPPAEASSEVAARRLEAEEVQHRLLTLIDAMPTERAAVLRARIFGQKDVGTIATELGKSSPNVSKLLKRGLEEITPALREFGVNDDVLQNLRRTRNPGGAP
ncbi:RNA polymerase sigma factor [Amycolatopsis sp. NBC_00438]|uniref:RNA polymerase sigma factor n=1 Tax=Amycolatopsis sp. NBC_00438 TaxID=2903558 RepID=UPI002E2448DF